MRAARFTIAPMRRALPGASAPIGLRIGRLLVIAVAGLAILAGCSLARSAAPPTLSEPGDGPAPLSGKGLSPAAAVSARADALYDEGNFAQALPLYQQAARAVGPGTAGDAINLAFKIARTHIKLRQFDDAVASLDRGLVLLAQASELERKQVEPVLHQARGDALRGAGKPVQAREEYERAAAGYQALGNEKFVARMQVEIGSTHVDEAHFSDALLHYEDARRRLEALGSTELGRLLVNTASLLAWLGQYDEALALEAQAELACQAQADALCTASALHARGFTYYQQGDYAAAEDASRRALQLFGAAQAVERARAMNNLGLSLVALQRPREALPILQQSRELLDGAAGTAKDKAFVIDSLASAYRGLGETRTAGRLYYEALLQWRVAGHREGERDTLANLGRLAAETDRPALSIFYYKQSVNLAQALRADARRLEPGYFDPLTRRLTPSYRALAGALVQQGRLVEAQQVLRMLKEQELFDSLRRDGPAGDTRAGLTGREQAQAEAYEQRLQPLFDLALELEALEAKPSAKLTPADRARIAKLQGDMRAANDVFERFLVAMNHDLGRTDRADIAVGDAKLAALQRTLDVLGGGAVVLHYVPLPDHLNIILTAGPSRAIRGYTVEVRESELNKAIFRLREQIDNRDPDVRATAARLYGWLLPPELRRDLADAGAKILMVSSTENLRYVPFGALYDGRQWLAERYGVAMFDDAVTDALGNVPQAQWNVHAFGMTQAVGRFPALTWVHSELDAIVGADGLPGTADFDAQFTLDRLRDALNQRQAQVLHIASHFVYESGNEDDSFLVLGVGRLTLTDVKGMKFGGLDLLTLSACETAIGGGLNGNGREVESFAALAQQRGAFAVLATLWPVDDPSTAAFMQHFYRSRRDGKLTKVGALQATQLAMIRGVITPTSSWSLARRGTVEGAALASVDYSHPYYWAPFVLSGNWR